MPLLLRSTSISRHIGSRQLFTGITISFEDGERTGLIGPNGAGKSTLLKILAGIEKPDEGELTTRRNLRLGYLAQEDTFPPGATVRSAMEDVLDAEHIEEHDRDTRIAITLSKIGFDDFEKPVDQLSGGWRKRLAIARQLVREPDFLLLDEPTNHLDLEGIMWLEGLLKAAPFAFLLCSHDRYFLENVTNRVVELNSSYVDGYLSVNGTYTDFLTKQEEYLKAQASTEASLASRVRREIEWLRRGAKARTTKAKGRIEEAGRLMGELKATQARNAAAAGKSAGIDFDATNRQTRKLLQAKAVSKSLGGKPLFTGVDFTLSPGTKLGLVGPNGSGKTSLIRLLTGELQPDNGSVFRAEGLRVVLFDQARKQLDKDELLRHAISPKGDTVVYRGGSMHITSWAKQFLFRTQQLDTPVGQLSGGEQARILVARMMLEPADLLILDEPTNDLDISSLEVLEESLEDFPGAVVLVTHDRYMLDRLCTELLGLDGQGNARIFAGLEQWKRFIDTSRQQAVEAAKPKKVEPKPEPVKAKKLSYMEQREWEQMEAKILEAEESLAQSQATMDDPTVLADHVRLAAAGRAMAEAQEKVAKLYERWESLEAKRG